ncbi:MAG: restriction endonuclease [Ignavibacteriales bacterium]|nr:restriction endonuclease [Ignavibacteriales bacterium]
MLFSKKNNVKVTEIKITYSAEYYIVELDDLSGMLSNSEILKNIFYYEGVIKEENKIKIHQGAIHEIEEIILEEIDIYKYNGLLKVSKEGILQIEKVKFNHGFYKNPTARLHCQQIGDLLKFDNSYHLISNEQSNLLSELSEFNSDTDKNRSPVFQFQYIQKVKNSIKQNEIAKNNDFDAYNPIFLDNISLEINPTDEDEISISPRLLGEAEKFNKAFNEFYDKSKNISPTYAVDDNTFLVLDEEKRDSLSKLKKYRRIKGKKEISDFINNIDNILPGVTYSERLLGWGEYKLSSLRGELNNLVWINEIDVNGKSIKKIKFKKDDGSNIDIPINIDKKELRNIIAVAISENKNSITLPLNDNPLVSINEAKRLYENINIIQENIHETKQNNNKSERSSEFALIKTDFEELDYIEESQIIKTNVVEIPSYVSFAQWKLFDYQVDGLQWLQSLFISLNNNTNSKSIGGLLADDMGVGKTLQILTFLSWLKEKQALNKALIIVPMTLINNWSSSRLHEKDRKGEIEEFFPGEFTPLPIRNISDIHYLHEKKFDIVIASYETLLSQAKSEDTFRKSFGLVDWDLIVCDEAQKIKNPAAKRTVAVKTLKGKIKIACTATPVENHMDELWSICDWVIPGTLGPLSSFRKNYISVSSNTAEVHAELVNHLKGYYLRRTKEEVLKGKLKNKKIQVYKIPVTEEQKSIYAQLVKEFDSKFILPLIAKLIGVMTHKDFLTNSIANIDIDTLENGSNKFIWLRSILTEIANKNEKVLIFTPSKWIQSVLKKYIDTVFKINSVIVNGDVKGNIRLLEIDSIRRTSGFAVLILSPEVAGYGLTITEANHIIHFSRGWNPAKENQATDRAYRIGQSKDVNVYLPIVSFNCNEIEKNVFDNNENYYEWSNDINKASPEENLDILMRRKGKLLKNFFSVASTISANELFENIISNNVESVELTLHSLIEALTPDQFEGFCALLFEKNGYSCSLTPISGDLGVDVVVHNYLDGKDLLIQVNKTRYSLNHKKVQEVVSAKITYEKALNKKCLLAVFTNSFVERNTIKKLIDDNDIKVFDNLEIINLANSIDLKYAQVLNRTNNRKNIIYN